MATFAIYILRFAAISFCDFLTTHLVNSAARVTNVGEMETTPEVR